MKRIFRLTLLTVFTFLFVLSAFIFGAKDLSAKEYDKTPEECTHSAVKITSVTKTDNRLNINTNYKNDNIVKGSTGVAVQYPFSNPFCVNGTAEVTLEIELEEAKDVDVYWEFGKQGSYNNGYITIKHDNTVVKNNESIANSAWNVDHVACHAGTNTLKYACRYEHLNWREIEGGRWFYVMPDYIPTFDDNDRCTQCGIQCSHANSETMFNDDNHWFQCQDMCRKTFAGTKHEHVLDTSLECMNCRYVQIEKDADGFYLINNPAQLAVFTKYVNEDARTDIKGKLTVDLNLNGCDFEPIGTDARVFIGEFDGGNHRIYNLNLNNINNPAAGLGFFGVAGTTNSGSAKISNLTIDESCSFASMKYTAGIVGYAIGNIAFDHCGNEANITSLNPESPNSLSGGIVAVVAQGTATFSYCYNTGTILGGSTYWAQGGNNGYYYGSGGICGYMEGLNADHCFNSGEVTTVLCETPSGTYYEPVSIHNNSFGNSFGAFNIGEECYNYENISGSTIKQYSSLTDGTLITAINNGNEGTQFIQGEEHPVLVQRKQFRNLATCEHEYVVSRYEWKNDYESCRAVAVCEHCGTSLVENVNATESVIPDVTNPGLEMHYFKVDFVHNDVFVAQKIAIEYRISVIHNITLNANGGKGTSCTFYYEGIGVTLPTDYIKDGKYIEGWYDNEELSGEKVTKVSTTDKEDKEFWAKYAEHTCTLEDVNAVAPTCTEAGMTAGKKCSVCGEIREGCDPIRPLGHSWVFTTLANRDIIATCDHEGCGKTITISLVNRGNPDFVIEGKDKWAEEGFIVPDIYYEGTGTTVYEKTIAMPTKIGTFKASMTYEGKIVSINFSVSFVDLDPESMTAVLVAPGNRAKAYENDVLECKTDAKPATIKWYYDDDNDGNPDNPEDPIGIGNKYPVQSPKDGGHRIIAVVTQPKDGDGNPRPADQIPTITTNNILVFRNLDPSKKPEIEKPDHEPLIHDDVIKVTNAEDITIEWYYDDDEDGNPDNPNDPICVGPTYTVKCPDPNNPEHDDSGHKIIVVIKQLTDKDGNPYPEGEEPTQISDPMPVFKELDPNGKPEFKNEKNPYFNGDEIIIDLDETDIIIEWYYTDEDGNPTGEPIDTDRRHEVTFPYDEGKDIVVVVKQLTDKNGKPYPEGEEPTQISDPAHIYKPLSPDDVIIIKDPDHNPGDGDVLEIDTKTTPIDVKWYYDDDGDGQPDNPEEPIGTEPTYTVKCPDPNNPDHDDTGHNIIAVVTQTVDEDGNPLDEDEVITKTTEGISITGVHTHKFKYTAQDNKIIASCTVSCDIRTGLELVLSAPKSLEYDGKAKVVQLNNNRNREAFPNPQVKYFQNDLEIDEVILPGIYLAKVTYGNAVAILEFEITKGIPSGTIPTGLEANCGQTLGSINLPNGWSWFNPDEVLDEAGFHSYIAIYTPENLDLYEIARADISINVNWDVVDNNQSDVVVSIKNSDGVEYDTNISVKVEVKTDVQTSETKKEYKDIQSNYVESDNEIAFVYNVKLIRTVNGVEEEIQPEDIAEGTIISIQMKIPEELKDKDFKVLHIHNDKEVSYVNYKRSLNGEYITVEVSKLSEFAFVTENAKHGFCVGYVVLIFALLLLLWLPIYIFAYFGICEKFMKACKLDCLSKKLGLLGIINVCVAGVLFIFALVALALHTCPVTIVSFILVLLEAIAFLVFFLMSKHNEEKEEPKAELVVKEKKERMVKKEEPVQEEKANEPVLEEPQEELEEDDEDEEFEDEEEEVIVSDNEGHYFKLRYNKSFTAKQIQATDDTKSYYQELKNEILSYKGTTSRISWNYDSINKGRANLVKFNFKRKHLYVYFALNADDYADSKYNLVKVESKKYQSVPAMFAVRNDRNLKYAKELIEVVCTNLGLEKGDMKNENYILPYEETKPLLERGLIKEVRQALQDKPEPKKVKVKTKKAVSAAEVNKMMSNEEAKSLIVDERKEERVGKKDIINVDVLARFFNDGDTVTIEKLKEKGLIANNVAQVKVLAYGTLDKKLNVELQDFSIEAAKMIILTGGTVKEV